MIFRPRSLYKLDQQVLSVINP